MHLSMVCSTSPTWGRWGNGRGFVLWISYYAPYMGQNYRVLPPSMSLSPMSDRSNIYCGASKKPNKHRFSIFLVSAQCWQMPHLARPMGPGFSSNLSPPCLLHLCPRWGRWGILLTGAWYVPNPPMSKSKGEKGSCLCFPGECNQDVR